MTSAALILIAAIVMKTGTVLPAEPNRLTKRRLLTRSKLLSFPPTSIYFLPKTIHTSMERQQHLNQDPRVPRHADKLIYSYMYCVRTQILKKAQNSFHWRFCYHLQGFFFYQNGLHVLLTKQIYKVNCEIIKKTNREKAFNKTKHMQNLTNIFWILKQWWKSSINDMKSIVQRNQHGLKKHQNYIKAPANLCDDRKKFIKALITSLFSSRL